MNSKILKELLINGRIDSGSLKKLKVSSYTYQKSIKDLLWLGVVVEGKSKMSVSLLDGQVSALLKRMFFDGFNVELLTKENIEWLSSLTDPKTTVELAGETSLSNAQTSHKLNKFAQFLSKQGNKYVLAKLNSSLFDFLLLVKNRSIQEFVWKNGEERLQSLPLDFPTDGILTGFSRFTEFGLMINPAFKQVYFPRKELSIEDVLSHAIKFSKNANDLMLCILFYLKNKAKFDVGKIEKNCEKLGVMGAWLDIIAYLEDQPVKHPGFFLLKEEFMQKARVYGIETSPRYGQKLIQAIFNEASKKASERIRVYFIGGNALIEHKAKNSTKDVDVVLASEKQSSILINALKKNGFAEVAERELQYNQLETSSMLQKKGFPRMDIFTKKICNALKFSKRMQERSKKMTDGRIELYLTSLEDIFLLKSVSSRDSDLVDCETILQKTVLNWKIMLDEIIAQEKNLKGIQELAILHHLETLEKRMNIKIPITKKISSICLEKAMLYLAKKPISIREIRQKIDFSETSIRNQIKKLEKEKKIRKAGKKPFKVVIA
ncbi:MAG: hypothetical protein QT12_C0015G0007 [archaeon GW2011_AR21]|uniref:HTH domain-containing protein n=1 Tax=Candidatus Iainarchaeum sp. TaxID=3101447 RepID=A0A7J4KUI7_9ARCH|nr:MAG: hypothetical protein QT12_C0015G0007 [archaeon GW2011_AR21]HIH21418.1 HTH domain-containing protein [Candidatus Diapherotrites archaeon]HIH33354.1 HTH domain-containing protein [Candidatus Diapherotrites archaeon]